MQRRRQRRGAIADSVCALVLCVDDKWLIQAPERWAAEVETIIKFDTVQLTVLSFDRLSG